jgi:hypothetical protein
MMTREDAFTLVSGERDYQEDCLKRGRWSRLSKTPMEFLADIRVYSRKAEEVYVQTGVDALAMNEIRKIAALCISAMERNGSPSRDGYAPVCSSDGALFTTDAEAYDALAKGEPPASA